MGAHPLRHHWEPHLNRLCAQCSLYTQILGPKAPEKISLTFQAPSDNLRLGLAGMRAGELRTRPAAVHPAFQATSHNEEKKLCHPTLVHQPMPKPPKVHVASLPSFFCVPHDLTTFRWWERCLTMFSPLPSSGIQKSMTEATFRRQFSRAALL